MAFLPVIICFIAGLSVSLACVPFIYRFAAALHPPSSFHQTHKAPVPRIGGLAFAAAFLVVSICAALISSHPPGWIRPSAVIFVTSLAIFALGFWDDLRALGAKKKFLAQILISLAAWAGGIQIQRFHVPLTSVELQLDWLSAPVTIAWLVALTNLINLIDGIDGLAAGVGLMLMSLLVVVGIHSGLPFSVLLATGLAGAQLGFLRYNFPPARIYMGDGGAYFIGFVIGLLTIVNAQKGTIIAALIAPMFALALPIIDVSTAILRRGLRGLPVFRADRKHIHHKLLARGFSRRRAVTMLYVVSLMCLGFAFAVFTLKGAWIPFIFGSFALCLLLVARSVDFSRDWLAFGRVIGNSIDLRKDTRYALPLVRWLELEAERTLSIDELWNGFEFICRKFRFNSVELGGSLRRRAQFFNSPAPADDYRISFELSLGVPTTLEFHGDQSGSRASFELLSELAAEAWFRAVQRWQKVHALPLAFQAAQPAAAYPKPMVATASSPA